jgi:hypothetical protein
MVGLAYQTIERVNMVLSTSDLIAVVIALALANTMLVIAFRRVYVLERKMRRYEGYYDAR